MTLEKINGLDREAFVAALGGIFEHSPWVAEAAFAARPFASVASLHRAMTAAVEAARPERQLALIQAHPDLAGKAARAGKVTSRSKKEQKGAGLNGLSDDEFKEFHRLNDEYRERFGFPFILAVRGHDKHSILAAFRDRLQNEPQEERAEALAQIARIARFRLEDLVG